VGGKGEKEGGGVGKGEAAQIKKKPTPEGLWRKRTTKFCANQDSASATGGTFGRSRDMSSKNLRLAQQWQYKDRLGFRQGDHAATIFHSPYII
jgi:hypothetical protein